MKSKSFFQEGEFIIWQNLLDKMKNLDPDKDQQAIVSFLQEARNGSLSGCHSRKQYVGENQYLNDLRNILISGEFKEDRTGTGTLDLFGSQTKYDLSDGLPLLTTKKLFTKGIIHELLWIISGDTNIKHLNDNGVHIWNEWADENGDLGPVYGHQWRKAAGGKIDQLKNCIDTIKEDPMSRRIMIDSWQVSDLCKMALTPCHCLIQFNVSGCGKYLDLELYQRSADMFFGVPFNIASYAMFLEMVAQICNLKARYFIHTFGSYHIYLNLIKQCLTQILRTPKGFPTLSLNKDIDNIEDFKFEDFKILYYDPQSSIQGSVSV